MAESHINHVEETVMELKGLRVMFTAEAIAERVRSMGAEMTEFYAGKPLTVVALTNGAMPFASDLIRQIAMPLFVDTLSVASYRNDQRGEELQFRSQLKLSPKNRSILLVDEVLDSGRTLNHVTQYMLEQGAMDVRTAVMVIKDVPERPADGLACSDWYGFRAPNDYLVGYGLDSHERYRNLPFIGVLEA